MVYLHLKFKGCYFLNLKLYMLDYLKEKWVSLSNIGVLPQHNFEKAKRIRIINRFSIIGIYIALFYTFFLLFLSEPVLAFLDFAIVIAGSIVILLQKKRYYTTAAIFMFVSIPLILLSIDVAYGGAGAYFYFFSLFILAYYIFLKRKHLLPILFYLVALFVFSKSFHHLLGIEPSNTAIALAPYFYYINFVFAFFIAAIFLQLFVNEHINNQQKLQASLNETLKQSNKIKTLLKELSHRTKNNLQFISSMLNIQAKQSGDAMLKQKCHDIRNRINAIALAHKNLYLSQIETQINARSYTNDLLYALININAEINAEDNIITETDVDDFFIPLDAAVTLGIVLNELLTNALKYGLKDVETKKLYLSVKFKNENTIQVHICDSSTGISIVNNKENISFGIELVKSLIEQEKGTLKFWEDNGNHVLFSFNYFAK